MKKTEFIGIDVSKATLDVTLYFSMQHKKFKNDQVGITQMINWVNSCTLSKYDQNVFCFEHTGIYSTNLCRILNENNLSYFQVSGLAVKRSMGLVRGKNDKVDAFRLSEFAYRHNDKLTPNSLPNNSIMKLKDLLSFRSKLVKDRSSYKSRMTEINSMKQTEFMKEIVESSKTMILSLNKEIKRIELEILDQIKSNSDIEKTFKNVKSIKGVGLVLGATIIAWTNNFNSFNDWRKFACYIGTAPFEHSSGTSYRGRTRVSQYGHRKLKAILFLCASSAIQHNPEIREYYKRKIAEGKTKMTALNGAANKLISRVFAVGKRQTPWVEIYKFAA